MSNPRASVDLAGIRLDVSTRDPHGGSGRHAMPRGSVGAASTAGSVSGSGDVSPMSREVSGAGTRPDADCVSPMSRSATQPAAVDTPSIETRTPVNTSLGHAAKSVALVELQPLGSADPLGGAPLQSPNQSPTLASVSGPAPHNGDGGDVYPPARVRPGSASSGRPPLPDPASDAGRQRSSGDAGSGEMGGAEKSTRAARTASARRKRSMSGRKQSVMGSMNLDGGGDDDDAPVRRRERRSSIASIASIGRSSRGRKAIDDAEELREEFSAALGALGSRAGSIFSSTRHSRAALRRSVRTAEEDTPMRSMRSPSKSAYSMRRDSQQELMMHVNSRRGRGPVEGDDEGEEGEEDEWELMDAPQLRQQLYEKQEAMEKCIDMGQNLLKQLGEAQEDNEDLRDENEELRVLLTENEEALEASTENEEALQAQVDLREKERRNLVTKLVQVNGTVTELQLALERQKAVMDEKEEMLEAERAELQEKMDDLKEDMQWQEEQAVAAFEAAENAKPNLLQLAEVCWAFTMKAARKVIYLRLKEWRDLRKKMRHSIAVLIGNARSFAAWEDTSTREVIRKFTAWSQQRDSNKLLSRMTVESDEQRKRADLVASALRILVSFITSAWNVCATNSQHWENVAKREGKQARRLAAQVRTDATHNEITTKLENTETTQRGELQTWALAAQRDVALEQHASCCVVWRAAVDAARRDRRRTKQLARTHAEEVGGLVTRVAAHEQDADRLREKAERQGSRLRDAEALLATAQFDAEAERAAAAAASRDAAHAATELQARNRELSRLRAELGARLAKERVAGHAPAACDGEATLTPMLRRAADLAAGLRRHAEDTSAAAARRRAASPPRRPHSPAAR